MRKEGEEFDLQKNKTTTYFESSIIMNADFLPAIDFYSDPNVTIDTPSFSLLKLKGQDLKRGIFTIEEIIILDISWLTSGLSSKTLRYRTFINDLYEFDISYDLNEYYQYRIRLNEEEIWYSEPFYQGDFLPGIPRFFSLTTNQSSLQTVGIYLVFSAGAPIKVDWGDGSEFENFTSGVELIHNYTATGTYEIKIYSQNIENITTVRADNSRISSVELLELSKLIDLRLNQNMIAGIINLPSMTGVLYLNQNQITGFNFASSGNGQLTLFWGYLNSNALTNADLSNMPIRGNFSLHTLGFLSSITFASSGNGLVTLWNTSTTALTVINLAIPNITVSTTFHCHSTISLVSLIFASSGNGVITQFFGYSCSYPALDFTNNPLGGDIRYYNNFSLTSVTHSSSGNGVLTKYYAYSTRIPNLDFTVFPTSDGVDIRLYSCSFTATEHDNQLINLDSTGWINGSLQILSGNTARTAASNTAHANLLGKGWSII